MSEGGEGVGVGSKRRGGGELTSKYSPSLTSVFLADGVAAALDFVGFVVAAGCFIFFVLGGGASPSGPYSSAADGRFLLPLVESWPILMISLYLSLRCASRGLVRMCGGFS